MATTLNLAAAGTPAAKHTTKCRFCGQEFTASPLGMPTIGEEPPPRVIKFVRALADHLNKKHRDQMDTLAVRIQDYSGLVIINSFETDDPGLQRRVDDIRHDIHTKTGKFFLTPDAVTDLVSRIAGLTPEQIAAVTALLGGIQDAYEEKGEYAPPKLSDIRPN